MKKATLLLLFVLISFQLKSQNCNLICNGNFDSIPQSNPPAFVTNAQMPCWYTTSPDSLFEVWTSGFGGVPSYSGVQFIEVNGYYNSTLYQSFYSSLGTVVTINFAHRGRAGVDTMGLAISPQGGPDTNLGHFGDGNSAWAYHSVNYTIPATGFYTIKFTSLYCASGNPTVGNFLDDVSVIGGAAILSGFSVQSTPCNLSIVITDTTQSGTTIFWDYGDGQTDSILNPNHVYANSGTYTITQIVTNGCDTVTNQQTITVSSSAIVSANFTAQISDCDSSVVFNNLSSNGVQYFWNFGDGNTDTVANPVHQYASSGAYQVYLIASNPCGSDTLIQNIQINAIAPLQPGFTIQSANCDLNIVITDQTQNGSSIFWNYGDGQTDSVLNPNHLYATNGNYTVTQTSTNGCDTIVTQQNVNVFNYPDATAVFNAQIYDCDSTVLFNNLSSNGIQYLWLFGDGNTDTIANPVHQYNAIGAYQVTLIVINPCDTDSISQNIQINAVAPLQPGFTIQSTNCSLNVTITDQTQNGSSIFWNYGDGQTDSILNPNYNYAANGTYTITQISTNGCDTIATQQTVSVYYYPNVIANFNPNITSCDSTVSFVNLSSNGIQYLWLFGDGNTDTLVNPVHHYNSTGLFQVTLIVINPCDTDSIVQNVQINIAAPLQTGFTIQSANCNLNIVITDQTQNGASIFWNYGDGQTDSVLNPNHSYTANGTYTISQTATNGCDTIITQHNVTIYSFPNVTSNFNPSITSCDSIVTFINQSTNALAYQWQFGDGTTDTVANPIHQYPSTGSYQVTLIATNPCDTDVYVMQVVLSSPLGEAQFSYILDTCSMQAFFTNTSINASDYLWLFGDGQSSTDTNPSHIYENSGVYIVMLITDAGTLCADTFKLTVDLSNASSGNLFIPNCFTPNKDGINEVFEISGNLDCYTYELKIFNRWGQLIFENKDNLDFWNGTFNSGDVPEGVYFYVFTFNDTKKIGSITVLR